MKTTVIFILGMLMASGCASSRLPPPLSAADQRQIKPLNLTVGIEPYQYEVYPEVLKRDLRKTKLFKAVDLSSRLKACPDLAAYVEERIYGTACVIPWLTIFTLGIIPTAVTERHGEVFSFGFPNDLSRKVRIEFTYESTTLLGWLALFMNLSPNWSLNPPSTRRYLDGLALAISTNAQAIEELTK